MNEVSANIGTDYKDEPYPTAASLLDILRASIVVDDPYALAVCAAAVSGALAATDIAPWSAQREVLARTHEAVAAELL